MLFLKSSYCIYADGRLPGTTSDESKIKVQEKWILDFYFLTNSEHYEEIIDKIRQWNRLKRSARMENVSIIVLSIFLIMISFFRL